MISLNQILILQLRRSKKHKLMLKKILQRLSPNHQSLRHQLTLKLQLWLQHYLQSNIHLLKLSLHQKIKQQFQRSSLNHQLTKSLRRQLTLKLQLWLQPNLKTNKNLLKLLLHQMLKQQLQWSSLNHQLTKSLRRQLKLKLQ